MGIESGSPRLLKEVIKKGITIEQVWDGMETLTKAGIRPFVSFMVGFPSETPQETKQTIDLALSLKKKYPQTVVSGISVLRPYPGAPIYEPCVRLGLRLPQTLRDWADTRLNRQGGVPLPWVKPILYPTAEYVTTSCLDYTKDIFLNVFIFLARIRAKLEFFHFPWELKIERRVRALIWKLRK
jgi:radical SAM superfamily enzyme YgiQ (UPF0313 family)